MTLFLRFKKDYLNYLISTLLPTFVSGLSIPIFKNLLGAEGYGKYSIWINAVLILSAMLSGWVMQGILRFYPDSKDRIIFSRYALYISLITNTVFFVPLLVGFYLAGGDILLALLCSFALFINSMQFTVLPIIQSGFMSKKLIFSEMIRIFTYVGLAICLLSFTGINFIYLLMGSFIISYSLSVLYLVKSASVLFQGEVFIKTDWQQVKVLAKKFFNYGAPLILWFTFSYMLSYIDKFFILKNLGPEVQGNYQSIFDLLSKSITILLTPIITSVFPLLSASYTKGDIGEIKRLVKKILFWEMCGFLLATIAYWSFGAPVLFSLLKIPDTRTYEWIGFICLTGTFVWQMGILIQKRFELRFKNSFLLLMVIIAFLSQIVFYICFQHYKTPLLYPLGYLLSAVVYVLLVSASEIALVYTNIHASIKNKIAEKKQPDYPKL